MKKLLLCLSLVFLFPATCYSAIHADTVWECRSTATANNVNGGGFYDRDPGTSVDYSQQDAAELNPTDLATDAGGTELSSATGGFTAAMAGNIIHITAGTGFTVGWYEITAYTDGNTVTIDRSAGANASSGTGYVGGAMSLVGSLDDEFFEQTVAGNTIYVEAGTYTLTSNISLAKDGTTTAPITVEGYNSSRGDNPTGTNRPEIACGAHDFNFDDWWIIKHLRMTGTDSQVIRADVAAIIENCKAVNSGVATRKAIDATEATAGRILSCEAESTNGVAIDATNNKMKIIGCYIRDSVTGIDMDASNADQNVVLNNIIDTCSTVGIVIGNGSTDIIVMGNTIYTCGIGISGTGDDRFSCINNIIDGCTTGASWATNYPENWFDYNCWDNTTDVSSVTQGDNKVEGDPGLTDPANEDFTLGSGSNCIDAGMQVGTNQGATGDYKWNIGADQDDVAAAAGAAAGGVFIGIF